MAGLGAAQYASQKDQEKRERKLASQTQALSPWTGMQAGPIQQADLVGTVGQGAAQGWAMNQNMERADQANELNKAQIGYYKANTPTAPAGGSGMGGGQSFYSGNSSGPANMSLEDPQVDAARKMSAANGGQMNPWMWLAMQSRQNSGG